MNFKKISCLALVLLFCFSICSCKDNKGFIIQKADYDSSAQYDLPESKNIASIGEYVLAINGDYASPVLMKTGRDRVWSTLPTDYLKDWNYEYGVSISESAIFLKYYDPTYESFFTINSSDAVAKGRILTEEVENGVKITYFFDEYKISVPVTYKLTDNGLKIKVVPSEIVENDFTVMSVAVAPFLCSAVNEKSDNRYLFVPSGSGALMYTDCRGKARTYEEEVYGDDLARSKNWNYTNQEQIHMPVFGAIDGNDAIYGIITSGAESSSIGAYVGDKDAGYSGVYPIFNIRSYNTVEINIGGTTGFKNFIRLADKQNDDTFEVMYNVLCDDEASVSGIASAYRDYLGLNSGVNNKLVNITMLGGLMAERSALGIPYTTFSPTAKLSDVKDIVDEVSTYVGTPINVRLLGYGSSGLTVGKIAGGFTLNKKLGKVSDLKSIAESCKETKSDLYFDFDVVNMTSSGAGYSKRNDVALDTTDYRVKVNAFDIALRNVNKEIDSSYIISRSALPNVITDATNAIAKFGISGISFSTLGHSSYSDFKDIKYYGKSGMADDVSKALKKVKGGKVSVCTANANVYAAVTSDFLDEIPTVSSSFNVFDEDVPFYGMVFSGCKENAVSVNLSSIPQDKFLEAVKTGSGLSFVLASNVNSDAVASALSAYISADYGNLKESIKNYIKEYKDYFNAVSGSSVKSYVNLGNGISKTVFENGVVAVVNKSDSAVTVGDIVVDAKSFNWR